MRIQPAERKAELRHEERQIPNNTEHLAPAVSEASFPKTFSFHEPIYSLLGSRCFQMSQGSSSPNTAILCSCPCLVLSQVAYPDACRAALEHSIRDGGPGWVYHGYKSRKTQATSGKVHGLHVKGIARRVVLLTQVKLAEA